MSEEVIDRVDQMIRKNNIKYKGNSLLSKTSKARRRMSRL